MTIRLLSTGAFVAIATMLGGCQANIAPPHEYAVYAEYSTDNKPIAPGWNTRVFNKAEVQQGASVALDQTTGAVTLAPGVYHVTASSMVTYFDPKQPTLSIVKLSPPAGYARLVTKEQADAENSDPGLKSGAPSQDAIDKSNQTALAISTVSNADLVPSLIDTFIKVDKSTAILLQHQLGAEVKDIYLHVNGNGSSWHVFARMTIERVV